MSDLHVSLHSPLDVQREQTNRLHDQDVTHIIAAEAEFANLFPEAQIDTLVWLQIPPSSAAAIKMTCMGTAYPTSWLLCYNSAVLRESGFAKFAQLLDDERYQKRQASKLLLSGLLGDNAATVMQKIRFVLDLGPSIDFDLRSEHLEALTLPKGIVQYSMMTRLDPARRVPISTAGGHDDACHCFDMKIRGAKIDEPGYWINGQHKPLTVQGDAVPEPTTSPSDGVAQTSVESNSDTGATDREATDLEDVGSDEAPVPPPSSPQGPEITHAPADPAILQDGWLTGSIWDLPLAPEFRIDDYCEVRHIANVIRLLLAMAGKPLHLNSAARVFTIAGLAKLFHLKSSDVYHINATSAAGSQNQSGPLTGFAFANRLRSIVSDWFFRLNNVNIVDILPEECFIIAWNIKLPVVARVAYRILVAERALQEAGTTDAQPRKYQSRQKSVFGRELSGLLDEDMETMIDHSSEAFVQRILQNRDTEVAETKSRIQEFSASEDLTATGTSIVTPDVVHKYEYESLTTMFRTYSGPIRKLQQIADVLTKFVKVEESIAQVDTRHLLGPHDYPVANALAAVRRLLDHLTHIVRVCFPRSLADSDLLNNTYTEEVQKSLSFYVRQNVLHKNWFVHIYNDLPDDKKAMTAVYWRLLGRSVEDKLSKQFDRTHFMDLVAAVNAALFKSLIYGVPIGTGDIRDKLRLDLLDHLKPMIGQDVALYSIQSMGELDAFTAVDFRYALYNHASRLYKKIYDRDCFFPEFELELVRASPHLLLGLSNEEFRFLPLWAGGDNDGTGAVFEPALPTAHLGPISPGPEYHTGTTETSMSTPSIDDTLSMAGPPSISDAGNTERYGDATMSDAVTARGAGDGGNHEDDDAQSVSSSFIMVRNFDGLNLTPAQAAAAAATATASATSATYSLPSAASVNSSSLPSNISRAVQDGYSTLPGTSASASLATPSSSSVASLSSSSPSVALTTSSSDDIVVVRPAGTAANAATATASTSTDIDFGFEYDENEDGIYNYEDDDDVEDQEYYDDDDDDAKSDDTVMPDRDDVEQAMRQDVQLPQAASN
ncbi:hypothetical protein HMPREF1624_07478 [Sporothrix schenckii ATCC 58251]|uniref:Uncharacterized protein n=1 Tax=Sporothrix schenckii (strain ATCC 58251 / de Perez 2211183) TaxID=1391915 RepID=U7PJZ0_SPOS1|nr:hypothetical protein HMPREF1624_07478 [Sporothrix schenckii ATCC 58251]